MSHIDTWDPKPAAGYDYMGTFSAVIPTSVPGLQIGGLFPKLAEQADKFSLIRGMTHRNNGHETAAYLMQTGHTPGERLAYPSVGAVFSLFKSPEHKGVIPPYVVLTRSQGRFSEEGFLGPRFKPFATGGDPNAPRFEVEGVIARGIYGNVFTVLVAGGGFKGGCVVGASDAKGEEVKDRPVYPVDLLGSIYQLGGIDASARLPHPMGLEAHVLPSASEGVKSAGLLTEIM